MTTHRCDDRCVCPVHDTQLIYWPKGDDHACQDPDCQFAHGMNEKVGDWFRWSMRMRAGADGA